MGLPGSGKTTLTEEIARRLRCVVFNADDIRKHINKDLGFSERDRLEQAYRMGHLCDIAGRWGAHVIADFVCPLPECRQLFGADYTIWVDRIDKSRYEDTNQIFVKPAHYDIHITKAFDHCFPTYHAQEIEKIILGRETLTATPAVTTTLS